MARPTFPTAVTELLDFLQRPSSYPDQVESVEMRETHISWVFLAGSHAYKLKKPVRFDFLDFSSGKLRKQACDAEVSLNRRLSPSVYCGVVPIRRTKTGSLAIGRQVGDGQVGDEQVGDGQVVDWLVKMKRLDDERTLDAVLTRSHDITEWKPPVQSAATYLAQFYTTQAPVTVRTSEFRTGFRRHVDDNERQLLEITTSEADHDSVRLIHSAQRRFLVTHRDVFDNRARDGRIVDGHGDLRPEHLYLYPQPLVIDCIEFNIEYRTNDIADELSFLAMECDRLGAQSVGRILFDEYARLSNDRPPPSLVAFYKSYRACVRAKVAALRSQQQTRSAANSSLRAEHDYLRLAQRYIRDLGPPLILLVGGLMGTGKSTLAEQLGRLLSAKVLRSDIVRRSTKPEPSESHFGEGKYSKGARMETYRALMAAAADALARNNTVILDATFSLREMRQLAVALTDRCGAALVQVECTCPPEVAMDRIADRIQSGGSASEAMPEFYAFQAAEADPPLASVPLVKVDTTLALGRQEEIVLKQVQCVIS
jgi:aminoglycoside phosphotransferase family enzyme/predicted kinase